MCAICERVLSPERLQKLQNFSAKVYHVYSIACVFYIGSTLNKISKYSRLLPLFPTLQICKKNLSKRLRCISAEVQKYWRYEKHINFPPLIQARETKSRLSPVQYGVCHIFNCVRPCILMVALVKCVAGHCDNLGRIVLSSRLVIELFLLIIKACLV